MTPHKTTPNWSKENPKPNLTPQQNKTTSLHQIKNKHTHTKISNPKPKSKQQNKATATLFILQGFFSNKIDPMSH